MPNSQFVILRLYITSKNLRRNSINIPTIEINSFLKKNEINYNIPFFFN